MPKARVQKRLYYKIGEACKTLGIQPYVLRYWETEFPALAPNKSRSGQRVYSEKELEIIRRIKELLYDEGYTIAGAKKKLEGELASGSFGGEDGDREDDEDTGDDGDEGEAEAPAPVQPPPTKPAPRRKSAAPPPAPAVPAAPPAAVAEPTAGSLFEPPAADTPALDTEGAERVQRLRLGIETALQEARELLALLDSKSPS